MGEAQGTPDSDEEDGEEAAAGPPLEAKDGLTGLAAEVESEI